MLKQIRQSLMLMTAAFIWGVAFVAQSKGGNEVGPYSFNCVRSFMGAIVLLPLISFLDKKGLNSKKPLSREDRKKLWIGGISCGIPIFFASNFQQVAIYLGSGVGKAGFLTACYILVVPLIGLFIGKKCKWNIWIGVVLALFGMYKLCISGKMTIQKADIFLILCAIIFSIQIIMVDFYAPICDGVRLASIEFLIVGILGIIPTYLFDIKRAGIGVTEWISLFSGWNVWISLLYAGVLSCGVAYTFQIIGQNGINPTVASMIMSLESVFSVIAGVIILKEKMTANEIIGCVLIFVAIIIAQIPVHKVFDNIKKRTV